MHTVSSKQSCQHLLLLLLLGSGTGAELTIEAAVPGVHGAHGVTTADSKSVASPLFSAESMTWEYYRETHLCRE